MAYIHLSILSTRTSKPGYSTEYRIHERRPLQSALHRRTPSPPAGVCRRSNLKKTLKNIKKTLPRQTRKPNFLIKFSTLNLSIISTFCWHQFTFDIYILRLCVGGRTRCGERDSPIRRTKARKIVTLLENIRLDNFTTSLSFPQIPSKHKTPFFCRRCHAGLDRNSTTALCSLPYY